MKYLFLIDAFLNKKGERLKNHSHYIIPTILKENTIDIDTILDKIEEEIGGSVVAEFRIKKVETNWDSENINVGDVVSIKRTSIPQKISFGEIVGVGEDNVEVETKQWGKFKFDKHTGTRTWYDGNGINYVTEYIEKAGPKETVEWIEEKERDKLRLEITEDLGHLNLNTLREIKKIIERDRN